MGVPQTCRIAACGNQPFFEPICVGVGVGIGIETAAAGCFRNHWNKTIPIPISISKGCLTMQHPVSGKPDEVSLLRRANLYAGLT